MQTYQQVRETLIALATREADIERYYAIGDRLVMHVLVEVVGRHRRRPRMIPTREGATHGAAPTVDIEPRITVGITNRNTRYIEWEDMTAAELEQVAYHKRGLERWIAGDLVELPASNTDKPVYDPSKDEE